MTRPRIALMALAYAGLLAHLLFIPYAYAALPVDEAVRRFAELPWLQLGSDQNVALVSRALMFAPLGLLLTAWVAPRPRRRIELAALVVAAALGCMWALAVNCAQLWFPSRTVSLNNLGAECLGVIGGALLWSLLGAAVLQWSRRLASGGFVSVNAALGGYVVVYLIASLMPFDLVTSAGELAEKAASDLYGWWLAPIGCGPVSCGLKFLVVALATVPCGWWLAQRMGRIGNPALAALALAPLAASAIELLHFLMVNGVSQGASIFVRTLGMVLGASTYSWRKRAARLDLGRWGRPAALALMLPLLMAIAYVGGWLRARPLGLATGLGRVREVVWMPFYYQYYAPYAATMYSTFVHVALYALIGLLGWLWSRHRSQVPLWPTTLLATLVAFAAETSKVFLSGHLPDYADVLIAAVSSTLALALVRHASRSSS